MEAVDYEQEWYRGRRSSVGFLSGETRKERQQDETWLIRFVVFLHETMGRTAQGIKQRLSGIRYAHIAAGYPDPLVGRVRLWAALAGTQRWDGAPVRKVPVTPAMLNWITSTCFAQSMSKPKGLLCGRLFAWGGSICFGPLSTCLAWTLRVLLVVFCGAATLSSSAKE